MQGFRPQRLVSESSTSSSRETEGVEPANYDEPFSTNECASTSRCEAGCQRNNGLERQTLQTTRPLFSKQKTQHEGSKRWSRDSFESEKHPKQRKSVTKNGKENSAKHSAIIADKEKENSQQGYNSCLPTTDCSDITFADETDGDTDALQTVAAPHNEVKYLSCRNTCQDSNKETVYHGKYPQQCTRARFPNHNLNRDRQEAECNTGGDTAKCNCHVNNAEVEAHENISCSVKPYNSANFKTNSDGSGKVLKDRNEIINDYHLLEQICHKAIKRKLDEDYGEIQKLRKNYISLKKLFLALATLNIILILCVVSVMPVILVTFKLSGGGTAKSDDDIEEISAKHLASKEAREVVKEHILCVDCKTIKGQWSVIFTKEGEKGCCLKDAASLVQRLLKYNEKKSKQMNSVISGKIKDHAFRLENIETAVFNESFEAPGGVIPGRQDENISKLINTLLTRKRSAVHLSGTIVRHHTIKWTQGYPKTTSGNLRLHDNTIEVKSGGVYFLYSCIRFDLGQCDRKESVGYKVSIKHGSDLASIHHSCKDGKNSETDLIIQKLVHVPVNNNREVNLHVEIEFSPSLVSKDHHHYYGLFEI